MGDLNAVDTAQQVHFEILQDGHCMQPEERIEFKQPLPASHTLEGLYIDDHIVTQILPSRNFEKGENLIEMRQSWKIAVANTLYMGHPLHHKKLLTSNTDLLHGEPKLIVAVAE